MRPSTSKSKGAAARNLLGEMSDLSYRLPKVNSSLHSSTFSRNGIKHSDLFLCDGSDSIIKAAPWPRQKTVVSWQVDTQNASSRSLVSTGKAGTRSPWIDDRWISQNLSKSLPRPVAEIILLKTRKSQVLGHVFMALHTYTDWRL